jgi:hypothetical protein
MTVASPALSTPIDRRPARRSMPRRGSANGDCRGASAARVPRTSREARVRRSFDGVVASYLRELAMTDGGRRV